MVVVEVGEEEPGGVTKTMRRWKAATHAKEGGAVVS
jgi:hypothetical protein